MKHGLIGQCYALMWAPRPPALPARSGAPSFECPTATGDLDFFEQLETRPQHPSCCSDI